MEKAKQMRHMPKCMVCIILALAMVLTMMPMMSGITYAATTYTVTLDAATMKSKIDGNTMTYTNGDYTVTITSSNGFDNSNDYFKANMGTVTFNITSGTLIMREILFDWTGLGNANGLGGIYNVVSGISPNSGYENIDGYSSHYWGNTNSFSITVNVSSQGGLRLNAIKIMKYTDLNDCTVEEIPDQIYNGNYQVPNLVVNDSDKLLVAGTDYTVECSDNKNVGTATVTLTGMGYYKGTKTVNFVIAKREVVLESSSDEKEYDGLPLTNNNIMVSGGGFAADEGVTFDVSGSQTDVGSSVNSFSYMFKEGTLADNYNITKVEGTLTVTVKDIANCSICITNPLYTGLAVKPVEYVKNGELEMTENTDYALNYKDAKGNDVAAEELKNEGSYTVTITGQGNNTGTKTAEFTIINIKRIQEELDDQATEIEILKNQLAWVNAFVSFDPSFFIYTGKENVPDYSVTLQDGTTLDEHVDYEIAIKGNTDAGVATMAFMPIGKYAGAAQKTVYFNIYKASQKLTVTKKTITVKYSKVKKKAKVVSPIKVKSNAKDATITYSVVKYGKNAKKYLTLNKKTGKITVKKGTPKGVYTLTVKAKASATDNYKTKTTKNKVVKIIVK